MINNELIVKTDELEKDLLNQIEKDILLFKDCRDEALKKGAKLSIDTLDSSNSYLKSAESISRLITYLMRKSSDISFVSRLSINEALNAFKTYLSIKDHTTYNLDDFVSVFLPNTRIIFLKKSKEISRENIQKAISILYNSYGEGGEDILKYLEKITFPEYSTIAIIKNQSAFLTPDEITNPDFEDLKTLLAFIKNYRLYNISNIYEVNRTSPVINNEELTNLTHLFYQENMVRTRK